jgi:predicted MFS family arabinose efflux permease
VSSIIERTREVPWVAAAAVLLGAGWGSNQFTPMLLVYHQTLGLSTGTLEAMFGFYALGLIPGLLLGGPLSDARGRRTVVLPAAALSLLASLALVAGASSVMLLFVGRLLVGASTGAAFSAGAAWLRELSARSDSDADGSAPRRIAIAMTSGFALGPLVAGLLAQWTGEPRVLPYLPHITLMVLTLALLRGAPETVAREARGPLRLSAPGVRDARFRRVVAPMAPWVFTGPVIAFALLPSVVGAAEAADGIALTAAVTAATALAGVMVQPLARRLDGANRAATVGLLAMTAGILLAALAAEQRQIWLLFPTAIVLGGAYGFCLVAGLAEVQRIAGDDGLAGLTAAYYTLAYLGFSVPYLFALGAHFASYAELLAIAAVLALATTVLVTRRSREGATRRARDRVPTRGWESGPGSIRG